MSKQSNFEKQNIAKEKIETNIIKYFWQSSPFSTNRKNSLHNFLKKIHVFESFTDSELYTFSRFLHIRSYEADEIIFKEGDNGFGFYLVYSGSVKIFTEGKDGEQNLITELDKYEFLGELSLLEKSTFRSATAVACAGTTLLALYIPDFEDLLEARPLVGTKTLKALSHILAKRFLAVTGEIKKLKQKVREYEES